MSDAIEAVRFTYDANIPDEPNSTAECNTKRHPHIRFAAAPYGIEMRSEKTGMRRMVPWGQVRSIDYANGPGVAKIEAKK